MGRNETDALYIVIYIYLRKDASFAGIKRGMGLGNVGGC